MVGTDRTFTSVRGGRDTFAARTRGLVTEQCSATFYVDTFTPNDLDVSPLVRHQSPSTQYRGQAGPEGTRAAAGPKAPTGLPKTAAQPPATAGPA